MRRFSGIVLSVCVAAAVAMPGPVRAEVDPDHDFFSDEALRDRINEYFKGGFEYRYSDSSGVYVESQPRDCNDMGRFEVSESLLQDVPDIYEARGGLTPSSGAGGDWKLYGSFQLRLSDYLPGESSGQAQDLRNYGAGQGPATPEDSTSPFSEAGVGFYIGAEYREEDLEELGEPLPFEGNGKKWYLDELFEKLTSEIVDELLEDLGCNSGKCNSFNVETPIGGFPESLNGAVDTQFTIGNTQYTSMLFGEQYTGDVYLGLRDAGITNIYGNGCWQVQLPSDPNFKRTARHGGNSWGADVDDQWAIKRVGFTDDETSAWNLVPDEVSPVVVAVIDTGLDWHHLDIDPASVWRNADEIPANGIDDDRNGYVDDVIGWDFYGKNNRPWDFDGHGTLVAGIIVAAHNDTGIAGINPHAKIMVLKAVSNFGTTRPSYIAEAIVYAVDNGAKVINISVGGEQANRMVQAAVDWAHQQGVLVVAAAGNEGIELGDYGPGGNEHVLTVGATHVDDRGAAFTNFGPQVDVAAPGVDVLSLRARFTDANYRPGWQEEGEYEIGQNWVGDDKRYLRASGTSFSAPIVSGIASLLLSRNTNMQGIDAGRILEQTAEDVDFPGKDKYTGHGMVDARAALGVDPGFHVTAEISNVVLVPADAPQFASVRGTIDASRFKRAWVQVGPGENPGGWRYVGQKRKFPIKNGEIATIPINQFVGADLWQVVVNVEDANGVLKRAVFPIEVP
jgi:subtilisin family serine protease